MKSGRIFGPSHVFPVRAREVWVLAPGRSLASTKVPRGALTFAVNTAYSFLGAHITYWVTADRDIVSHWAQEVASSAGCVGMFVRREHANLTSCSGLTSYVCDSRHGFSADWKQGLYCGAGSASVALQLAVMSGAKHIHLAGLDLGWEEGEPSHFLGEYHTLDGIYSGQIPVFRHSLRILRALGISWTNHSPISREVLEL